MVFGIAFVASNALLAARRRSADAAQALWVVLAGVPGCAQVALAVHAAIVSRCAVILHIAEVAGRTQLALEVRTTTARLGAVLAVDAEVAVDACVASAEGIARRALAARDVAEGHAEAGGAGAIGGAVRLFDAARLASQVAAPGTRRGDESKNDE